MRVNVRTANIELTDLLKSKIEKRVRFLFRNLNREVLSVNLCLFNENIVGSESKTCCQIHINTRGLSVIYAEHKSTDMYVAFDAAAHRAHKYTAKRLSKFNRLLSQLKHLKTKKIKSNTLKINKSQQHTLGGMA
ncbi:MAG: HPF/RaiA family ribosome-associated protein [Gammaproteobacteria bacterium]